MAKGHFSAVPLRAGPALSLPESGEQEGDEDHLPPLCFCLRSPYETSMLAAGSFATGEANKLLDADVKGQFKVVCV